MIRGWAICTDGWTGSITCGSDVATATAYGSAISQALLLASDGVVTLAMRDSGVFRISRSSAFAASGTGNMGTRLGFTLPSGSATTHTAGALALGLTAHGYTNYDPGSAVQPRRGVAYQGGAYRRSRGLYEWRQPQLRALMTLEEWLAAMENWNAYLTTPAEIDVIEQDDSGALTAYRLQAAGMTVRPRDGATWLGELQIDCTEAPA